MPKSLTDLTPEEQSALLNAIWNVLVGAEAAADDVNKVGSPLGRTAAARPQVGLNQRLPSATAGLGLDHNPAAWTINGSCSAPDLNATEAVSNPGMAGRLNPGNTGGVR